MQGSSCLYWHHHRFKGKLENCWICLEISCVYESVQGMSISQHGGMTRSVELEGLQGVQPWFISRRGQKARDTEARDLCFLL